MVFDKPGTRVGKKSSTLSIKYPDEGKKDIAIKKIGCVIVTTRVQITYDALKILAINGIPVIYVSGNRPIAVFHPFALHGTVLTRRAQFLAYLDERGTYLAKNFVHTAMRNRCRFLRRIQKTRRSTRPELSDKIDNCVSAIEGLESRIDGLDGIVDDIRWTLMGIEGTAARKYFEAYTMAFSSDLKFLGRMKRPPGDPVNSCLSFGYTMLYGEILIGIATAGLEPFAGFLHSDRSGKPSLALDLIEEFRQITIDRLVLRLFTRKQLQVEDFEIEGTLCLLSEKGRELFINEYQKMIEDGITLPGGKRFSFKQLIIRQARKLTRFLVGKDAVYESFLIPV
ncbi:MAG: CRISPR-associated endonuclease Cas1 [Candidatus Helarchaeota archaeon]